MGIWDRLGSVINSYINDMAGEKTGESPSSGRFSSRDPDLDAAFDELNDFLNQKDTGYTKKENAKNDWQDFESAGASSKSKIPPEELRADFELLGVSFGADADECKAAYKKLLKIHHPDRHTGHEGNYKKATEKSAKLNAAYDRIEKWRESRQRR
ncbi:MAG: J domain-containing protein [Treponema sp.]|jgi:curved DNA-binding protein CbpA|nr:J domain-containing protein [Treponema sp.]